MKALEQEMKLKRATVKKLPQYQHVLDLVLSDKSESSLFVGKPGMCESWGGWSLWPRLGLLKRRTHCPLLYFSS